MLTEIELEPVMLSGVRGSETYYLLYLGQIVFSLPLSGVAAVSQGVDKATSPVHIVIRQNWKAQQKPQASRRELPTWSILVSREP